MNVMYEEEGKEEGGVSQKRKRKGKPEKREKREKRERSGVVESENKPALLKKKERIGRKLASRR